MARTPVTGPLVVPQTIEVVTYWLCGTRTHSNVYHGVYTAAAAPSQVMANALMTGFVTQFTQSGWNGFVDTDSSLQAVGVRDLRTPNNVEFLSNVPGSPGTSAGAAQGAQVSIVVTLRTNLTGRAFRGRTYLGCLADNAIASAFDATVAADTAAAAFVTGLQTVMSAQSIALGVMQRALNAGTDIHGNPLPARVAQTIPVTAIAIVNARLDSQRRRLGR